MYHKHLTEAIVLDSFPRGEFDNGVLLFTRDFGLINAFSGSSRKIASKLRAGVQPFCFGQYSLIRAKPGMKIVGQIVFKNYFEESRKDRIKVEAIKNITVFLKKIAYGENLNQNLFYIIKNSFDFIIEEENSDVPIIECLTVSRILYVLGYLEHSSVFEEFVSRVDLDRRTVDSLAPMYADLLIFLNRSIRLAGF